MWSLDSKWRTKKHGTTYRRRSNLVPVSHPLFEYGLERLKVVQVMVPEFVAKNRAM